MIRKKRGEPTECERKREKGKKEKEGFKDKAKKKRESGPFFPFSFLHTERTRIRGRGPRHQINNKRRKVASRPSFVSPFLLSFFALLSLSLARFFRRRHHFFHLFLYFFSFFSKKTKKAALAVVGEDRLLGLGEFLFLFVLNFSVFGGNRE